MKKLSLLLLSFGLAIFVQAQKKQLFSVCLLAGVNKMAYDRDIEFIHEGAGAGLQVFYNSNKKLKPLFEIYGSFFSINKIAILDQNGEVVGPKNFVLTTLVGFVYTPLNRLELGATGGLSFFYNKIYTAVNPSIGFFLGKNKIVKTQISLTNVFERDEISKKNSGFINLGLSLKIF